MVGSSFSEKLDIGLAVILGVATLLLAFGGIKLTYPAESDSRGVRPPCEMRLFDWILAAVTLVIFVLLGAAAVGGVAFLAGFLGPMFFSEAPQGPLLGLFTGPAGVLVGAVFGAIYWHRTYWRHKRDRKSVV